MKVYISGPVTGVFDLNRAAFDLGAAYLEARGDEPVNPLSLQVAFMREAEWADYMRVDIRALLDCEGILVLPGWEGSRGACLEVMIARELGMRFTFMPLDFPAKC